MTKRLAKKQEQSPKGLCAKLDSFPTDKLKPIWTFANIDRDGDFAFNPSAD